MAQVHRLCSGIALVGLLIARSFAADQTILGQREQVKDPTLGVDPATRKLVGLAKEPLSHNTIVGDPTAAGATVTFFAFGGTSSSQAFALPQATDPVRGKPLWITALTGFKYKDTSGVNGPVKSAEILKSCQGTFTVKVTVVGRNGPITMVPPNPGIGGCMLFEINGGDRYHVWLGSGTISSNKANSFTINDAATEGLCGFQTTTTSATSTTHSTTSTTTSSSTTSTVSPCFTDLGNGTVQDTCTGLQWEKKTTAVGSGSNYPDLHDVDNTYVWAGCCGGTCTGTNWCQPNAAAEATCEANTPAALWAAGGCNQCASGTCMLPPTDINNGPFVWDWLNQLNASNFAGHSDWRLPSQDGCNSCRDTGSGIGLCTCGSTDLQSLLTATYSACSSIKPCIWPIFGPTVPNYYWSGSTEEAAPGEAWGITFGAGGADDIVKYSGFLVRAVRGDAAPPTTITTTTTSTSTSSSHTTSTHGPTTTNTSTTSTTTTTIYCFTDPGDGTVKDNCTGLQWEKKTTPAGSGMNPADLHDVDNQYAWAGCCSVPPGGCCGECTTLCQPNKAAQAACRAQTPAAQWASGGCNVCPDGGTCNVDPYNEGAITTVWDWLQQLNAARFAGHSNWRLPVDDGWNSCTGATCNEQYNLFDDTVPGCNGCDVPCIDPIFGPADNAAYWSATTAASQTFFGRGYPTDAWEDWFVCGGDQEGSFDYKDWPDNRVRAVRDATGPCAAR